MQTIYHVFDDCCEIEGMFSVEGELLDCWALNDAQWRHEYFNGFMSKLGYRVDTSPPAHLRQAMLAEMREIFECDEDCDDND
jgi:hypothetical protein